MIKIPKWKRYLANGLTWGGCAVMILAAAFGRAAMWVLFAGIAAAVAGVVFLYRLYRCPGCGRVVLRILYGSFERVKYCPHCGEKIWVQSE